MTESAPDPHRRKMARKKAARERLMARIDREKGLLIVHTGPGKGKTTAALGMALRALGHGFKVGLVQFIKGARDSAERKALAAFGDQVAVRALGEGFTWETQDKERDIAATRRAWEEAAAMIADPAFRLVILDEINVALRYGYLDLAEVLAVLVARPAATHVVATGRGAKEELIAAADLVTEMTLVKHPFREGIKAQPGIEF
ncbi:MAG: cob(I)yrinic acid a,c-diamide adenosyltransferase [Magnetospirillum sp. WYHS-4]